MWSTNSRVSEYIFGGDWRLQAQTCDLCRAGELPPTESGKCWGPNRKNSSSFFPFFARGKKVKASNLLYVFLSFIFLFLFSTSARILQLLSFSSVFSFIFFFFFFLIVTIFCLVTSTSLPQPSRLCWWLFLDLFLYQSTGP